MSFDGLEIDMLSLGDADCIVVTRWHDSYPHRVLIDGGSAGNSDAVVDFLKSRGQTAFWAVLCTHAHSDHAGGLIKVIQDRSFSFSNCWMHDIRKHLSADSLRRASASDDAVKEVVETTRELASAFNMRGINPQEPFAGSVIASYPDMKVLGPTLASYRRALEEFTKERTLGLAGLLPGLSKPTTTLAGLALATPTFGTPLTPPTPRSPLASLLAGTLANSSVGETPRTQQFNNTSAIIGTTYLNHRLLFTGDAGADALDDVPSDWRGLKWMQVPHHASAGNLSQKNIERFCPEFAYISARGDSSHPSRAIVNGLIKVGSQVFSTHVATPGHLWFSIGRVPSRGGYGPAEPLKATGGLRPLDWDALLARHAATSGNPFGL